VWGGGRNFCTALSSENFVCDTFFITDVECLTASYPLETTTMILLESSMHFTVQFRMIPCDLIVRLLSASKTREVEGTWRARFKGLQKAWVNCTGSRVLATRRDCFRPISFNTVSTLDTIMIRGLPICPCMMPCRCC
jgi:hypothetical protein